MPPSPSSSTCTAQGALFKSRLLRQVSLRTCLIVVTLGCIALAIVAQRAREQRLAVERIRLLRGSLSYDYQQDAKGRKVANAQPPGWPWLRSLLGEGYFERVVAVHLDRTPVCDADLEVIGKLRGVGKLSLNETRISDAGLQEIRAWKELRYLGLGHCQVTSDGLRAIEGMRSLDTLILEKTAVGDRAVPTLAALPKLRTLNLGGSKITSAALPELAKLPLVELGLRNTVIDDGGVGPLCRMKSLTWLSLSGTHVSGEGLWRFRKAFPQCTLDGEFADLTHLGGFANPPAGFWRTLMQRLDRLNRDRRLKLVDLSRTSLADDQLPQIITLTNLEMIDLEGTRVTSSGIDSLERSLPDCKIVR